jgi:hypothetical protein
LFALLVSQSNAWRSDEVLIVYLPNLRLCGVQPVFDVQDCLELFQIGTEAKHVSATKMNPDSSRSHW